MIIDLSVHNGTVDFSKITGVEEVFIRASLGYGTFDKKLAEHANGAAAAGLPVSYYHFGYPSRGSDGSVCSDAQKEATYFVDTISNLPQPTHLAIDLEKWDAVHDKDTELTPEDFSSWLKCFLDTVETKTGVKCVVYSYADYLNHHLPANHIFGEYPLWIANYNHVSEPTLPHGWDSCLLWQFTENGEMAGITGHVDFSKTT